MNELKHIVENIQSVFSDSSYPQDFLDAYDQMECLASRSGKETFLVRRKSDGKTAIAKCYDCSAFPLVPHISTLAGLDHPGLPRFYESFSSDSMVCLVREYVEGEPLSEYASASRLSEKEILSIAAQLCDILSVLHAHQPPVIHRDIKPENIIVRPDNTLVLIDFDIARTFKENAGTDTVFFGTKGYAPPEQYGFGQTDARTDIYALGVLLRCLVTDSTKPNPNITINPRLQAIIDRATAFSPEDRYPDIASFRRAVDLAARAPRVDLTRLLVPLLVLAAGVCLGFFLGRGTDFLRLPPRVRFTEPLVEKAVRLQLGLGGDLSREDLERVTRLYIYGSEVYSNAEEFSRQLVDRHAEGPLHTLSDLSQLPNLEEVHIARQGDVDISALSGIGSLHTVQLKHLRISGVSPISCLRRLRHAILFDSGVYDTTALEACPWLETLDIGHNPLGSFSVIGSHPSVRSLCLMWLDLPSLDGLAERFPMLTSLMLQHGNFPDLSGLRDVPHLKTVYVLESQKAAVLSALEGTGVEVVVTEN